MKNYYEILEVNQKASTEVIEKAYKVLVKRNHPDLYEGIRRIEANQRIKEINEAYEVLSNSFLREQYDLEIQKEKNHINIPPNIPKMEEEPKKSEEPKIEQESINHYNEKKEKAFTEEPTTERGGKKAKGKRYKDDVGTFSSMVSIFKGVFKRRNKGKKMKDITQNDILSVILTIIVVILIGIVLWFIPFTNGWMRELIFENPLFSWIGKLFS